MMILTYFVPNEFKSNKFVESLYNQAQTKRRLSLKQEEALQDIIGIELDFYGYDILEVSEELQEDYDLLMAKYKRNRFKTAKGRNKCIRAMESIIKDAPRHDIIDDALGRNFNYGWRR